MSDLTELSGADLASAIAAGETSSVEATHGYLERIDALDGRLNTYLHVDHEGAVAAAEEADGRRRAGEELPTLSGVPIAVKEDIAIEGLPSARRALV